MYESYISVHTEIWKCFTGHGKSPKKKVMHSKNYENLTSL